MRLYVALGLTLPLLLVSCGGPNCGPGTVEKDGSCVVAEGNGDSETDADTDADSDTDTDTDTDADADPPADADGDGFPADRDCDDGDASINPDATEVCDPEDTDEDCNNLADDNDPGVTGKLSYYRDEDGDGFGGSSTTQACNPPSGYVSGTGDCDDANANIGAFRSFYQDLDGDGYGDANVSRQDCNAPAGFVENDDDCNDVNGNLSPGEPEVCDSIDNDCDSLVDDDDSNRDATTGSSFYCDSDGDGYAGEANTTWSCLAPAGCSSVADDCDDANAAISPGASEVCNDGIDNNCDQTSTPCGVGDAAIDAATESVVLYGSEVDQFAGSSITSVGDPTNDGQEDFVVGAPTATSTGCTNGSIDCGLAFLVNTRASGTESLGDSTVAQRVDPPSAVNQGYFGFTAAGAGDITGDGVDDFVVGMPEYGGSGVVYLYEGGSTPSLVGDIEGYGSSYECGYALAVGDFIGSSDLDVAVGCPQRYTANAVPGAVYFIEDVNDFTGSDTLSAYTHDEASGQFGGDGHAGASIAAPDVNGDGSTDLVITAPGEDSVYLFMGKLSRSVDESDADEWVAAKPIGDTMGVGSAGDVDSDGYEDTLIGSPDDARVWLYLGSSTGWAASYDAKFNNSDSVGWHVAGGPDVNGDGYVELLMSDPGFGRNGLIYCAYGPFAGTIDLDVDASVAVIEPSGSSFRIGSGIASAGDWNLDGYGDLLLGTPSDDTAYGNAGAVVVLFGGEQ